MATIWTPKEKPVVLDKFCHLSLDAQKVMASMYRDFHQRKADIKAANTLHNAAYKDTRGYSGQRSKQTEFCRQGSLQEQRGHNLQEQDGNYLQEQRGHNLQEQDGNYLQEQRGHNLQEQRGHNLQEQRHRASSSALNGTFRESHTASHFNTDKPSLSRFLPDTSEKDLTDGKENRQGHNTGNITGEENMHKLFFKGKDTLMPDDSNPVEHTNHYVDSPPVETRDFEILSQYHLMDTQDDLFSDSISNNKRNVATMLEQSKPDSGGDNSLNDTLNTGKGNGKEIRLSTASLDYSSDNGHIGERFADSEHSGLKLLEMNEERVCYDGEKQNCLNLMIPGQGNIDKSTDDHTGVCDYGGDKWYSDRQINKSYHCDIISDDVQSKQNGYTDLNLNDKKAVIRNSVRDGVLCEESPYLDRTPEVARKSYSTAAVVNGSVQDESYKKKHKLKQTKITFERLGSKEQREAVPGTILGRKHFIEDECSEVHTKKRKNCSWSTDEPVVSVAENIIYINKLPADQVDQVCSEILQAEELVLCLVFANGSTQLRDNLFAAENKKKATVKVKKDSEVDSIAVCSTALVTDQVYMFSMQDRRPADYEKLREFWGALLGSDTVRKIGFQIKEVYLALFASFGFEYNKVDLSWTVMDAGVAVWLLDPDKPVSNFEQLLSGLNMPQQTSSKSCIDALQADMALLSAAMKKLFQMLHSKDMWNLYFCLETKLVNVLAGMEMRQMSISIHTLLHFSAVLKKNLTRLEEKAHKAAGHAFLLNSHHQLRQVLFEKLKLDTYLPGKAKLAKTSVTRETSTSETVLTQLLPFHPLPEIILEYRQLQKLKSTYIDGILSCVSDSYLTTHWDQTSAATGRLSSHHPNIQAIPKLPVTIKDHQANFIVGKKTLEDDCESVVQFNARDPFISRPQWSLLSADFQQIELRLLGHLADDPMLLNIFNDTAVPDIFNALAAQWLGKGITDVTDADREQTKRVVYSVMYGVGKEKLADYLKCTPDNAKAIMASFLLKFPAVNQFTKSCVEFCQKHGYTCTIFKRRRLFPNIRHSNAALRAQAERQCVNFCVQGSAADICKAAMLQVENALAQNPDLQARLLVQIHDELLLEVADSDLNYVTGLVKRVMESEEKLCGSIVKLKVPIPVSISLGKKWGQMEPVSVTCDTG